MLKNMAEIKKPDYILLTNILILIIFGILILSSVSTSLSQEKFGNSFYYLNHQLLYGLLPGIILGFLAFRINLNFLKKISHFLFFGNLIILALVFLPGIGISFRGANRWIEFGPISFQPSEFLKLTSILYFASWISSRMEKSKRGLNKNLFAFFLIIILMSLILIFQPDISTLGIIFASCLLIYFLAETPFWHSFLIFLIGFFGLSILIKVAPYRLSRLIVFLNPEFDPLGIGYQIKQALIGIGSGGFFGKGLGLSEQRFGFLPQSISDSIFAIFAEETGFIGSSILILLFLIFFWRGFKIGKMVNEKFLKLTAFGITFWISIQTFVNIGAMIGILPLTGIPLPFISYGGSHLLAELIGMGILLNISRSI